MASTSRLAWILLGATLAACGGGGDGTAGDAPILLGAAYVGAGATPAVGDVLLLQVSQDVSLLSGAILDDEDVVLSDGTLGAVTFVPTLDSPRTVRVVLGAGVTFRPGITTIDFAEDNDIVVGANGILAAPSLPRVVEVGDGDVPRVTSLTIEGIDGELNGTGPAGGRLQVPRSGFAIDLTATDPGSGIDPDRTVVSANVDLLVNGTGFPRGRNLAPELTRVVAGDRITLTVPQGVLFPAGEVTLAVTVGDASGMVSAPATFAFRTVNASDDLRPFEDGQLWFLDTSRDVESYATAPLAGRPGVIDVTVTPGANGRADLEDVMLVAGLLHSPPITNVSAGQDSNQVVMARLRSSVLTGLGSLYDGADVTFTFDSPGAFPAGQAWVPYGSFPFSQICIGGAATADGRSGTLGAALLDPRNQGQVNDCLLDFQGLRLGVFLHTAVRFGMQSAPSSSWRTIFDPFTAAYGGTPIGADPQDGARLAGTLTDQRTTQMLLAIDSLARVTAVITAHECGHSMGLVRNGPMPGGLYGGDAVNFPLSRGLDPSAAQGHIQNLSLFPPGSQNVMSPAIDFDSSLSPDTAFNSLNRAYFRERALYDD